MFRIGDKVCVPSHYFLRTGQIVEIKVDNGVSIYRVFFAGTDFWPDRECWYGEDFLVFARS